jgi:hypothetical protein
MGERGEAIMKNLKIILFVGLTLALLSGAVSLVCAVSYNYSLSHSPDPAMPNTQVAVTFTTDDPTVTQVTFTWYTPDNTIAFTDGPKTVSGGSATSQYSPNIGGVWSVYVVGANVNKMTRVTIVQDINIVPEIPIIGTAGAVVAMVGGFVYKNRKARGIN